MRPDGGPANLEELLTHCGNMLSLHKELASNEDDPEAESHRCMGIAWESAFDEVGRLIDWQKART